MLMSSTCTPFAILDGSRDTIKSFHPTLNESQNFELCLKNKKILKTKSKRMANEMNY